MGRILIEVTLVHFRGRAGDWRRRVGSLRVDYRIDDEASVVDIAEIGSRSDVY